MKKLLIALASVAALTIAACSTTVSQVATDVQLVAAGVEAVLSAIKGTSGISSDTITEIEKYVTIVKDDAAKVAADTSSAGTDKVQEIVAAVKSINSIIGTLAGVPSGVTTLVNAAVSLLPTLLQAAGITSADAGTQVPVYSAEQARAILSAVH